jgi:hypothetical protein
MRKHFAFATAMFAVAFTPSAWAGSDVFVDMVFRNGNVRVEPHFRSGASLLRVPYPNARDRIIGDRTPALVDHAEQYPAGSEPFEPAYGPPSDTHKRIPRHYPAAKD